MINIPRVVLVESGGAGDSGSSGGVFSPYVVKFPHHPVAGTGSAGGGVLPSYVYPGYSRLLHGSPAFPPSHLPITGVSVGLVASIVCAVAIDQRGRIVR